MKLFVLRRFTTLPTLTTTSRFLSSIRTFSSNANGTETKASFYKQQNNSDGYNIEVVDNDTWQISSSLAHAWRGLNDKMKVISGDKEEADCVAYFGNGIDFDEIDDKRIRGDLFYKLDRDSKEFEEYSFDFHRRKKSSKESSENNKNNQESKMKENFSRNSGFGVEKLPQIVKNERVYTMLDNADRSIDYETKKKVRTPTFNQLTGPYHEPFCLDIYISKASVRACIVHRVTSKVVAVAHSISKDMKFDLSSTRNPVACAAVGKILAQRALADDIHDVVYTPRRGERLEGKLQIVLQSIIDNGINVKVKLKQRKPKKACFSANH